MTRHRRKTRSFRFSEEQIELLERLSGSRTYTDTVVRGLELLDSAETAKELSNEELLMILRKRLMA